MSAFGLQFGHGLGLALHERPIISRVVSLDHPTEIKEGMVFALETYCPATDGYSAARIEEEVVVTDKGCRVITLFPARHRCTSQSSAGDFAHPTHLAGSGPGVTHQRVMRHLTYPFGPCARHASTRRDRSGG